MSATPRTLADIDTPAVVIDLDLVQRNIETMERHLEGTGVHVRPHVKHHKTPGIALMQIEAGAPGVTCAKVGEAEAMVEGGVGDVLIANQVVGPIKIARLCDLARQGSRHGRGGRLRATCVSCPKQPLPTASPLASSSRSKSA